MRATKGVWLQSRTLAPKMGGKNKCLGSKVGPSADGSKIKPKERNELTHGFRLRCTQAELRGSSLDGWVFT